MREKAFELETSGIGIFPLCPIGNALARNISS